MKIGIDARFLTHPQTGGFKTYSENLVSTLAQIDSSNNYIIYVDWQSNTPELPVNENFVFKFVDGTLPGIGMPIREQIWLGREFNKDKPNIVHHLCNTAPINPYSYSPNSSRHYPGHHRFSIQAICKQNFTKTMDDGAILEVDDIAFNQNHKPNHHRFAS